MVEFLQHLFATYNLYGMTTCAVFLAAWFYISRAEQTQTANPLDRKRRQQGPPVGPS
jgi:hypothetical protein